MSDLYDKIREDVAFRREWEPWFRTTMESNYRWMLSASTSRP